MYKLLLIVQDLLDSISKDNHLTSWKIQGGSSVTLSLRFKNDNMAATNVNDS